jgi:hypothetical protein
VMPPPLLLEVPPLPLPPELVLPPLPLPPLELVLPKPELPGLPLHAPPVTASATIEGSPTKREIRMR